MTGRKSRLNLIVPTELNAQLNSWAQKMQLTLSELARKAFHEYIWRLERETRDQELVQACKNYRQFNKKFSAEWAQFETRIE